MSQGSFTGFCIRFAEDFDAVSESWYEDAGSRKDENACYVPEASHSLSFFRINETWWL